MFHVDLLPLFCVTQTVLCAMWTLLSPTQGSSLGESIVVEAGSGSSPMSSHGQLHLSSTSTKTWRLRRSRLLQRRLWLKRNPGTNKQCQAPCSLLLTWRWKIGLRVCRCPVSIQKFLTKTGQQLPQCKPPRRLKPPLSGLSCTTNTWTKGKVEEKVPRSIFFKVELFMLLSFKSLYSTQENKSSPTLSSHQHVCVFNYLRKPMVHVTIWKWGLQFAVCILTIIDCLKELESVLKLSLFLKAVFYHRLS